MPEKRFNAAHAVGDDTSRTSLGYLSLIFTHGTLNNVRCWFKRGYQYGDFEHGDTFSVLIKTCNKLKNKPRRLFSTLSTASWARKII